VRAGVESEEEEEIDLSIYIIHLSIFYTRLIILIIRENKKKTSEK
jgi:hypothetical protein